MSDTGTVSPSPRAAPHRASYLQQLLDSAAGITTPADAARRPPGAPAAPSWGPEPTGAGVDTAALVVAAATATATRRTPGRDTATEIGVNTAACLAACADTAPDPVSATLADWTRFGTVVPVLGGGPGAGASVLAVVLADALAAQGLRVLLVDAADPLRSGLTLAAGTDGPAVDGPHPGVRIRQAHRGPIRMAHLEFLGLPVRSAAMVPAPAFWAPTVAEEAGERVDVTVVDVGWDSWTVAALPLQGPGGWLRHGCPAPRPVLVVRATAPGVRAAETLLGRLAPWQGHGVAPVTAAVLTGCRKPATAALAVAGHHLEPLLTGAVCLPADAGVAERGVTDTETPARLQHALTPLLSTLGLLSTPHAQTPRAPTSRSRATRLLRRPSQHEERNPS